MVLRITIATLAPIITSIQLFPQLYKTYNAKSVDDLSLFKLILIMINNLLWLIHVYFIFDYSLIMSGICGLIINTILLIFYNIYVSHCISLRTSFTLFVTLCQSSLQILFERTDAYIFSMAIVKNG